MKINGVKIFAAIITLSVVSVVVLGFVMAGSPNAARSRNADQSRVESLQQITNALDNYWNANKSLPKDLASLSASPNVYLQSVNDPKTGEPFGYTVVSSTAYELCADFETLGNQQAEYAERFKPMASNSYDRLINHDKGRQCFQFNINKWNEPMMK